MVNYLDLFITEVYKQFIVIKENEYRKSKRVFDCVFKEVKQEMKNQCKFFQRYSKQDMYAGSVYDRVKVGKMDEFDMDIVIKLPVNYNKIAIETDAPGFVRLKIPEFDLLPKQNNWEDCHSATLEWRDEEKYLLQNKFRQWMHGIIQTALNVLQHRVVVDDVVYLVNYKESGPAYTLKITKDCSNDPFELDVDLVPVIRFQTPRWPGKCYRQISSLEVKDWLAVPKPNKFGADETVNRTWRLSFQEFERYLMRRGQHLKPTIRLLKKLRDSMQMDKIASYYIKTLFLWKINKEEETYWKQNISDLFRIMVRELYDAVNIKKIPYFWHEENNLLKNVDPAELNNYSKRLKQVVADIDLNKIDNILSSLLTKDEFKVFQNSEFYLKHKGIGLNNLAVPSTSYFDENSPTTSKAAESNVEDGETSEYSLQNYNIQDYENIPDDNLENVNTDQGDNEQDLPKRSWSRSLKKVLFSPAMLMMVLAPSNDISRNPQAQENIVPVSNEYIRPIYSEDYFRTNITHVTQDNMSVSRRGLNDTDDFKADLNEHVCNENTSDRESKGNKYEDEDFHHLSDDDISW